MTMERGRNMEGNTSMNTLINEQTTEKLTKGTNRFHKLLVHKQVKAIHE